MSNKNTYSSKKRRKKKNPKRTLIACLVAICIVAVMIFAVDGAIGNMYNEGEEIPENMQTAEEIKDDVVNILVCGVDMEEGRDTYKTDVIMYVTMDIKAGTVKALQIPRDTFVGEPSKTGKINSVYSDGSHDNGIMNLVETLNQRFGLAVDHYATLDMEAFVEVVDWIEGGLEMYVPYPITIKDGNGNQETIIKEAGWHYVNGETAEAIVRNRNYAGGDIQRMEVQSYFYASVIKYFKEIGVSDSLKLLPRFTPYITTDMHWSRIAGLATEALNMDYSNMAIIKPGIHGYDIRTKRNGVQNLLEIPQDEWLEIINKHFRPYQEPVEALHIDEIEGEVVNDYGATGITVTNLGDLLAGTAQ
ncbi:MAG: LCP family protein [Oscillospiraceae bacterium]|nr:LCP family protein [Oscillospiraceae bacterium]MBP1552974.1 LCP family protein [Oscillospiraceae bacterium]